MRLHTVVGHLQLDPHIVMTTLGNLLEFYIARVGNESAVPGINAPGLFALFGVRVLVMDLFSTGREEVGFAVESFTEGVVVVENELVIVKEVDHDRRVGHAQESQRLGAAINVNAP